MNKNVENIYGIDFSQSLLSMFNEEMVRYTRNVQCIQGDLIEMEVSNYVSKFDWVYSGGLTEHFYGSAFDKILEKHHLLCKREGYVTISVPNFHGINYLWRYLFDHPVYRQHNLMSMRPEPYIEFFKERNYEIKYSGYVGTPQISGHTFKEIVPAGLRGAASVITKYIAEMINKHFDDIQNQSKYVGEFWSPNYLFCAKKNCD